MNELEAVVAAARLAEEQAQPALLATVVRVRGSAYRRPGARMLLTSEGWQAGSISGGCLEADILRKAWWRTRDGERIVVTYDSTMVDDETLDAGELAWGFGLGCNGVVEVLLERIVPGAPDCPVAFIADCLRAHRSGILATVIASDGGVGQRLLWPDGADGPAACTIADPALAESVERDVRTLPATGGISRTATYANAEVFLERIAPPRSLVICGAGHDAAPLARMAHTLGWQVTVVDPHPGVPPRPDRFPGATTVLSCAPSALAERVAFDTRTCAVVMSHNVLLDAALLGALLPSPVGYIGVLGPRRRTERLLAELRENGIALSDLSRLHGPVGLDIGADTPETIALSILAEMQAVIAGREGSFLRDRDQPIHDPAADRGGNSPVFSAVRGIVRESVTCPLANRTLAS